MRDIEKTNINHKINIDKRKDAYYNETKIEIFTIEDLEMIWRIFCTDNEKINGLSDQNQKYEITPSKINNEHDKIFRSLLSNKKNAAEIINLSIENRKSKYLKDKIKPEDLQQYNSSFITEFLENQESDIVYKMKEKEIYFLIEHQTKVDYQ